MFGARNIVKIMILTVVILLSGMACYVYAQPNTGAGPYINSWHTYRVVMGGSTNDYEWDIVNTSGTDTLHIATKSGGDLVGWVDATRNGTNNDIAVFFDDVVFDSGQTWELLYREFAAGTCVAARKFAISLTVNDFYLTLAPNATICKDESGDVFDWNNVDNEPFNTVFTYRVTLHKVAGLTLTGWSFDANIALSPVNHSYVSYTVAVSPVGEGTASVTDTPTSLDGQFTVNVTPPATPNLTIVSVDVTVTLSGLLHNGVGATLNLLNGIANSGATGPIITFDNTGRPTEGLPDNVADAALRDRLQVIVIDSLPATQNILAGAGETATSAINPLQNSTHRYTVRLGNMANNYANAGTGWRIETALNAPVANVPANYVLTSTPSATNDDIAIAFHMAPGNYILFYTEVGDNGCSAQRQFPFTLGEPFDVDIANIDDDCAAIDGEILPDLAASTTTVVYTVTLNTANYGSDWSFTFGLGSALPFGGTDLDVSSVTVTGGTYTGTNYLGTVQVASPGQGVTISVVYNGLYFNSHTITATLTNITGSFNEADADILTGTGNSDVHIIHSMPQVTALAGVD
jgi:hypothetical protein